MFMHTNVYSRIEPANSCIAGQYTHSAKADVKIPSSSSSLLGHRPINLLLAHAFLMDYT
jgi:hypothetical protein